MRSEWILAMAVMVACSDDDGGTSRDAGELELDGGIREDAGTSDAGVRDDGGTTDGAAPFDAGSADAGPRPRFVGCEVGETIACDELASSYASGTATCRPDESGFDVSSCAHRERDGVELVKPADRDPERWGDALANNGGPWSFEVDLAPAGGAPERWVIRLGGGGFCDDHVISCVDRGWLAKAVTRADGNEIDVDPDGMRRRWVEGPGGSTPNTEHNPDFWNVSFAQFNYKSSTLWTGASLEATDTSCRDAECVLPGTGPDDCDEPTMPNGQPCTGRWYRRGRINIRAGVEALIQRFGLDDANPATRVMFVGTSAGSYGVLHTADIVAELLPQTAARGNLYVLADGAWADDWDDDTYFMGDQYTPPHDMSDVEIMYDSLVTRFGGQLLPACVDGETAAGRDPARCIASAVSYPYLVAPPGEGGLGLNVFVQKSLRDLLELGFHRNASDRLLMDDADGVARWETGQRASLAEVDDGFAANCIYHTTVTVDRWWEGQLQEAISDFIAPGDPAFTEGDCPPPMCAEDDECDDADPETADLCVSGLCAHRECAVDADCDDGDASTFDFCRQAGRDVVCVHHECFVDADCESGTCRSSRRCE